MLVETLFCVVFFLTPLMAMVVMVIHGAVKVGRNQVRQEPEPERVPEAESISKRRIALPIFQNPGIFTYQLVENRKHRMIHKRNKFKKGGQMRAGP